MGEGAGEDGGISKSHLLLQVILVHQSTQDKPHLNDLHVETAKTSYFKVLQNLNCFYFCKLLEKKKGKILNRRMQKS